MAVFDDTKTKSQYCHLISPRKFELLHLGEHLTDCIPMELFDKVFPTLLSTAIGIRDQCY